MDVAHEAKALARDGADHGLILSAIAHRRSRGVDAAGQCRFGDDAAVPDGFDQIVLGDDAVPVFDQIGQQIEYLRLDGDIFATPRQFTQVHIKHMIGKVKLRMISHRIRNTFESENRNLLVQSHSSLEGVTCNIHQGKANLLFVSF